MVKKYYSEARELHEREKYEEAYKLYELGADAGDEKCYYGIALFLHKGYFVEKDEERAAKLFAEHFEAILALANNGDAEAMYIVSCYYSNGFFVEENTQYTFDWLQKSAEAGYSDAQWRLGIKYFGGYGVEQSFEKAVEWYTKSAEQDNSVGQWRLGYMYAFGRGIEQDLKKALEWYTKSAEQGNSEGQWRFGAMYESGECVKQNYDKALEWYTKSAEQDNSAGQWHLGSMYEFGKGVEQNYDKAVEWYIKSAEQDNSASQWYLGAMYDSGRGVEQNYDKAVEWYTKSAEQGDSKGQWRLGCMYKDGEGVEQDYVKALEWYTKSAEQGDSEGQYYLAFMYIIGAGIEQDVNYGIELLNKLCSMGHKYSTNLLGALYYDGEYVDRDYRKAFEYWSSVPEEAEDGEHHFYLGQCYHNCRGVDYDITDESTKTERLTIARKHYEKAIEYGFNCRLAYEMVKRDLGVRGTGGATRVYAEELLKETVDRSELLKKVEKELIKDFGGYWDMLKENAKLAMISGLFYYVMNISCGDEACKRIDFTNVVATMSKALEIELAEFFGKGYIEFLRDVKKIPAYKFDPEWNKFVIYPDRPYERKYTYDSDRNEHVYVSKRPAKVEYCDERNNYGFSLGSLYYLLDIRTVPLADAMNSDEIFHRNIIDTKKGKSVRTINSNMKEYVRKLFREDAFGGENFDEAAVNYLIDLAEDVRFIKDIRNPADHEMIVNRNNAEVLSDALIKSDGFRILCELLEKISPEYIQKSLEAPLKPIDTKTL